MLVSISFIHITFHFFRFIILSLRIFYSCFCFTYIVSGGLYHLGGLFLLLGLPAAIYLYVCMCLYLINSILGLSPYFNSLIKPTESLTVIQLWYCMPCMLFSL